MCVKQPKQPRRNIGDERTNRKKSHSKIFHFGTDYCKWFLNCLDPIKAAFGDWSNTTENTNTRTHGTMHGMGKDIDETGTNTMEKNKLKLSAIPRQKCRRIISHVERRSGEKRQNGSKCNAMRAIRTGTRLRGLHIVPNTWTSKSHRAM